jgi:hypothetical protein
MGTGAAPPAYLGCPLAMLSAMRHLVVESQLYGLGGWICGQKLPYGSDGGVYI